VRDGAPECLEEGGGRVLFYLSGTAWLMRPPAVKTFACQRFALHQASTGPERGACRAQSVSVTGIAYNLTSFTYLLFPLGLCGAQP